MDRGPHTTADGSSVLSLPAFAQAAGGSDFAQANRFVAKCAERAQSPENPAHNTDGSIHHDLTDACQGAAQFDQRPGEFEATRGLASAVMVYAARTIAGLWRVAVMVDGQQLELSPVQARRLADDLRAYAFACDEGNGA